MELLQSCTKPLISHYLSGEQWYLQHNCVGDAIVYHKASIMIDSKYVTTWSALTGMCSPDYFYWRINIKSGNGFPSGNPYQEPLLLTWFNFNPSMDK